MCALVHALQNVNIKPIIGSEVLAARGRVIKEVSSDCWVPCSELLHPRGHFRPEGPPVGCDTEGKVHGRENPRGLATDGEQHDQVS